MSRVPSHFRTLVPVSPGLQVTPKRKTEFPRPGCARSGPKPKPSRAPCDLTNSGTQGYSDLNLIARATVSRVSPSSMVKTTFKLDSRPLFCVLPSSHPCYRGHATISLQLAAARIRPWSQFLGPNLILRAWGEGSLITVQLVSIVQSFGKVSSQSGCLAWKRRHR